MVSNKTMSLGGEHGSSGVNGKGLVKSALTTGFNVSSLASKELDESFFNGVVHHGIAGWPSVAVLEEGVDDLCGVQFAGGIVVGVTWAVSSVRVNAKGGENGVEMSGFGCVGVGFVAALNVRDRALQVLVALSWYIFQSESVRRKSI